MNRLFFYFLVFYNLSLLIERAVEGGSCEEWRKAVVTCVDTNDTLCFLNSALNNSLATFQETTSYKSVFVDISLVTVVNFKVNTWPSYIDFYLISSKSEASVLLLNVYQVTQVDIWFVYQRDTQCSYIGDKVINFLTLSVKQKEASKSYIKCAEHARCMLSLDSQDTATCATSNTTYLSYQHVDVYVDKCENVCQTPNKTQICMNFRDLNDTVLSRYQRHDPATTACVKFASSDFDSQTTIDTNAKIYTIESSERESLISVVDSVERLDLEISNSSFQIDTRLVIKSFRNVSVFLKFHVSTTKQVLAIEEEEICDYTNERYLTIYHIQSDIREVIPSNKSTCVTLGNCEAIKKDESCLLDNIEQCDGETSSCSCQGKNLYLVSQLLNSTERGYFLSSNNSFSVVLNIHSTAIKKLDTCRYFHSPVLSQYTLNTSNNQSPCFVNHTCRTTTHPKVIFLGIRDNVLPTYRLQQEHIYCDSGVTYINVPLTKSKEILLVTIITPIFVFLAMSPLIVYLTVKKTNFMFSVFHGKATPSAKDIAEEANVKEEETLRTMSIRSRRADSLNEEEEAEATINTHVAVDEDQQIP